MSRLVVVSNRVTMATEPRTAAGGLAVAVLAALRRTGGLWFGWSGALSEHADPRPRLARSGRVLYATLDLTPAEHAAYYNGHANSALWPLFHDRLDLMQYSRAAEAGYNAVNRRFAQALAPMLHPGDLVWVHDYHLIPFALELRRLGIRQPIGFFLHIPFPAPPILRALPNHEGMLRAFAAYDLVGFQTPGDVAAFSAGLALFGQGQQSDGDGDISAFGRSLRVRDFPISIETAEIEREAPQAAIGPQTRRLKDSLVGRSLIIGVDRLDYSKGLPQRFRAFDALLERFPENRGHVTFMQVAPPSRGTIAEYADIRRQLEGLAGHINGNYAEFDWMPLRYLNKSFSRATLVGFFRASRVGLVTPLRDGMNLVAKEYVAAQSPEDPGVLVLSAFAGTAAELDAALIVNPYDVEGVAEALQRALVMPLEERRDRHARMMAVLRANDIDHWRERYVDALAAAGHTGEAVQPSPAHAR